MARMPSPFAFSPITLEVIGYVPRRVWPARLPLDGSLYSSDTGGRYVAVAPPWPRRVAAALRAAWRWYVAMCVRL